MMESDDYKIEVIESCARLTYAIIMMDGEIDEAEQRVISEKLSVTPMMAPLQKLIEDKPDIMITEAYQDLLGQVRDLENPSSYQHLFECMEELADAGMVMDEDDADILQSILENLKSKLK